MGLSNGTRPLALFGRKTLKADHRSAFQFVSYMLLGSNPSGKKSIVAENQSEGINPRKLTAERPLTLHFLNDLLDALDAAFAVEADLQDDLFRGLRFRSEKVKQS